MKYYVCNWEDNGYHDSYFYGACWDTESKSLETHSEGATAYAGGWSKPADITTINNAPGSVYNEFKEHCINTAAKMIFEANKRDINEPDSVNNGDRVVTIRRVKPRKSPAIEVGTKGTVFWQKAYGQFYRNGYNRPNRSNTRLGIKADSGDTIWIALNACKLDKEVEPLESIVSRLRKSWNNKNFSVQPLVPCKAWLSESYIY